MHASNAVELKGVRKAFGTCVANADVSFAVPTGSIHAIVGENGAGKSTAMKILYGQYGADGGEILVEGKPRVWRTSADAIEAGLGMVHQHFMLAETHTALENILMGTHKFPYLGLNSARAKARIEAIMAEFGLEVPLSEAVGDLPVGVQQRIEILKLLYRDSKILILDEPTAVLAPTEIDGLFRILRGMAAKGKTILIITHKLKEVMALAERVTVFRAGRVVAERKVADTNLNEIACLMVGREIKSDETAERASPRAEILLEARAAKSRETRLEEVSFRIRAGEILGIAGVEGNGQSELLRLLLDPRSQLQRGNLQYFSEPVERQSAADLRAAGVAVFPEDRLREALLLDQNLTNNFILGRQRSLNFRRGGIFLSETKARAAALSAVQTYDVRPGRVDGNARELSGGNQQKLVVARELQGNPRLLFASQPTRGVDIGAVEFIHGKIVQLRDSGAGVLLISSELDEVLKLSDRLLVLYRGRVVGSFERKDFDEKLIGPLMAGGTGEAR